MTDLALPIRLSDSGEPLLLEEGTAADVIQRSVLVCATRPGEVDGVDDYGLYDQAGRAGGADLDAITARLDRWVPDAAALVDQDPAALDDALALVGVQVAGR